MFFRIRMLEVFKDGNILEGQLFKAGHEYIVSDVDKNRIAQSGGLFDVIEALVKNPLKGLKPEETPALKEVGESKVLKLEETVEAPQPVKRKAGRPKKNAS
jgi:hypothetical protein